MSRRNVKVGFERGFNAEGIYDFLLGSIDRRIEDIEAPPFHEWAKSVILDGKPFTFRRHEYLIEPYKDDHPHQVEMKRRRVKVNGRT